MRRPAVNCMPAPINGLRAGFGLLVFDLPATSSSAARAPSNSVLAISACGALRAAASSFSSASAPLRSAGTLVLPLTMSSIAATPPRPSARLRAVVSVVRAWARRERALAMSLSAGSAASASAVPGAPLSPAALRGLVEQAFDHIELGLDLGGRRVAAQRDQVGGERAALGRVDGSVARQPVRPPRRT
jgi:hypothetical protein